MRKIIAWVFKLLKEARGNALWDLAKWLYRNATWIVAVMTALFAGVVGVIKQLPLPILIVLVLGVGVVAYFVIRGIARYADNRKSIAVAIPVECGHNVKGSVVKANGFTFYRARIEPSGNEQFPNLLARLHGIKRDGVEMQLDEVLQIKYHPGDGSAPCARKGDPAFLDVVFVYPNGAADLHVRFWPPGMTNWNFESGHNYRLDFAILSDEISRRCEFEFVWTGDTNTSSCRLISDGSRESFKSPALIEVARKPRLKVSYDRDSLECMHPVEFRTEDGKVLLDKGVMARLRFETETESDIPGCKAAITSIEKNGQTVVSGVRLPLLFNPAHDPNSDTKTIKYGQPEYLEVIWMSESGETEIKTKTNFPYAFTKYQKLDRSATYSLHVAVSTPDITPEPVILRAECKNGAWMLSIIRAAVGTA